MRSVGSDKRVGNGYSVRKGVEEVILRFITVSDSVAVALPVINVIPRDRILYFGALKFHLQS